ncbi:MAG TPA: DUF4926 domain-containing protein [Buttiauxella sp.]|uniref:DUF4926 domain-containing protein n=1 Tax=Buttiauxella sp. TaxID=1972222 RepID=UPI002B47D1B4|nr:DUF4926 domain-containing protein [Buttiauxella sp.]HKM97213.1 DUF4926 domain-containing protein [Buttiauxella sp.]
MMREEIEVVVLTEDLPEEGLTKGQIGTIVIVFTSPRLAYLVEFCDDQGRTIALPALLPHQVEDYIP